MDKAKIDELQKWLKIAQQPYTPRFKAARQDAFRMVVNLVPALLEYVRELEIELQGWRHERAMTLTTFAHVRDGGDPALIGHPNGSVFGDALREMLDQQRREGAAAGIERAREMLSMAESGEEADEMMRAAAKRLREGK